MSMFDDIFPIAPLLEREEIVTKALCDVADLVDNELTPRSDLCYLICGKKKMDSTPAPCWEGYEKCPDVNFSALLKALDKLRAILIRAGVRDPRTNAYYSKVSYEKWRKENEPQV